MPNSIIANSIMGWKIDFPEFFPNGTVCYCLFCDVNDNKQLFWFYHKNIFKKNLCIVSFVD